jgi:hypothetical protein
MEIWEPKPPGTLWAMTGLLRDSFTFYDGKVESSDGGYVFENFCDRRIRSWWSLVYVENKEQD